MGCCSFCLPLIGNLALVAIVIILIKKLIKKFQNHQLEKMLDRWSQPRTSKDSIILHSMPRAKTVPTVSPFALKIETYFRMCGIKYETDFVDMNGPKGKFPWISMNGEHVADSEFIIEFISKKFSKTLSNDVDEKALTTAMMARLVLEEHFFWGMSTERFIFERRDRFDLTKLAPGLPSFLLPVARAYVKYELTRRNKAQGMGLHSESEIIHLMKKDLRAISTILGDQKFICGDEPCEEDAGIFGILAQVVFSLPDSPYEKFVKDELKNLVEYCNRIKSTFWPDWNNVLDN